MTVLDPSLKVLYDTHGYVIIPASSPSSLIPSSSPSSPFDLETLRTSAATIIKKTRSGEWKHRRVVGKQFPPFGNESPDSWGVQHVMHPELGEEGSVLAKWYTSERVYVFFVSDGEVVWRLIVVWRM